MTYACIQMFMEKLKQLINCNDIPLINDPLIVCKRPQFQLLYDELGSMIQTLFMDEYQDLEKVKDLKKRFTDAAEEACYIVDLFLSAVHIRNIVLSMSSQNKKYVRRLLKSIQVEFMSMRIDSMKNDYETTLNQSAPISFVNLFLSCVHVRNKRHFPTSDDFKWCLNLHLDGVGRSFNLVQVELTSMDSSNRILNQSAAASVSFTGNSQGSKKQMDEIVVGLDGDLELIRDKLVEGQKKVDVVSIVGMGGIGKTTLATIVFNDGYVKHHFHVRVWVTVSQTYDKRDVLIQILESIRGQLHLEKASDSQLRETVHKNLMGKRYLIVIDDIWHIETWNNLKLFFPHDNIGSRILLTSRLTEVAKHANSYGLIHHLGYLSKERSWKLLCEKVFHGNEFPDWAIKPGMQIVKSCHGLPLAVIVIAGVLAKDAWSEQFWVENAERTGSYIVGDQNGCLETLSLSYNHLPRHLSECFLYLGGFPEDYKFRVRRLISLWIAEGFIVHDGNRSLEDIAEGYLMDLIDRNLVTVHNRKSNGDVKTFKLHDLVRELCLRKAKEEEFILQTERLTLSSQSNKVKASTYMPWRLFIKKDILNPDLARPPFQSLVSILCFCDISSLRDYIANPSRFFVLLRVLDLQQCCLCAIPYDIKVLVHLRYLAIRYSSEDFPSSICSLWNLQTLIYENERLTLLPSNISDLVNLRHLWSYGGSVFFLPSMDRPMKLQTFLGVMLGDGENNRRTNLQKCFPYIKELTCRTNFDVENDFKSLTCLEKLKLSGFLRRMELTVHGNNCLSPTGELSHGRYHITFPTTLKTLTLAGCGLPWSDMSIIQSLPNLQVLKLHYTAFEGSCWNTDEQEFRQLIFLRLEGLNIKLWETHSTSFPCLIQLEIISCYDLEEISLEIGEIPTLELIKAKFCSVSLGESVTRIQQEQHNLGNDDLKIELNN